MIDIKKYKVFVNSKIVKISNRPGSYTKKQVLDYCCQFSLIQETFFKEDQRKVSQKLKRIFDFNLDKKPKTMSINNWFLHEFGYKYCGRCNELEFLDSFNSEFKRWDKLKNICRKCEKLYYENNKEKIKKRNKKYRENNKDKLAAKAAKYRAKKLQATLSWLTKKHFEEIELFYIIAQKLTKNTGIIYHVDHIVPLNGDNVNGLHVPWNLQVITKKENLFKGNKYL